MSNDRSGAKPSLFQDLPDALKAMRGDRSQAEMAKVCGKTQTWWSYLEGGWRNPRVPDLVVLSRLGLSLVGGGWTVTDATPASFDPTDARNALAAEKKLLDLLSWVPGWTVMQRAEVDRILNECEALRVERDAARIAVCEYVEAVVSEADVAAEDEVGAFPGPEQIKAKTLVNLAYERLYEIARAA